MRELTNTLLLTATVIPPSGVPELQRTNPKERMDDYLRALKFYCSIPEQILPRIVFAENSGADLSQLHEAVASASAIERVEFLSFSGLDYPPRYGRGYGEFKLLDYAIENASTFAERDARMVLWKVTGRYRVLNIRKIIRNAPSTFELYCDMRNWPIPWMDSRIFGCTLRGYEGILKGVYAQLRQDVNGIAPEQYLHGLINQQRTSGQIVDQFNIEPFIDGIRGKDSKNYASGLNFLKYLARASKRTLGNRRR